MFYFIAVDIQYFKLMVLVCLIGVFSCLTMWIYGINLTFDLKYYFHASFTRQTFAPK